jgi:N-acyl-D-aspartate/D-glutamate deacylase
MAGTSIRISLALSLALTFWVVLPGRLGGHPVAAGWALEQSSPDTFDILIKGGRVVDGSGADPLLADVGIRQDRIIFVGNAGSRSAARTINASGMVVTPGFIDPHTHTVEDLGDPARSANLNYLMQGVTTVVTGNDGASPWPIADALGKWERQGIGTNAAVFVGHGTVRALVLGDRDVAPTPDQLARMKGLIARGMEDGAIGMSTGLYYAPGSFATTEEVIELARAAAAKGGIYDTHMRDEDSYSIGLLGSIEETIRIGREARIPVHISHIKALGTEVWGKSASAIDLIRRARAEGIDITASQYPYTASGTSIVAALVPRWAEEGGRRGMLERLDDPATVRRLIGEMEVNLRRRGGPGSLLITTSRDTGIAGKTLARVAAEWKTSPVEAALEIIKRQGDAGVASFNMAESDIDNFMQQDFVMTGSDGSAGHPRKYGTFPRKLREYVYAKSLITLPFAIRSCTSLTAATLRIPDRGLLRQGNYADVIVFDEKTIADRATYEHPRELSVGMRYVIVNGKIAVDDGKYTGALAGRVLRKGKG